MSQQDGENPYKNINTKKMSRSEIHQTLGEIGKAKLLDIEMKRLGFWDPSNQSTEDKKLGTLNQERDQLQQKLDAYQQDEIKKGDALNRLNRERKQRIEESRKQQKLNRKPYFQHPEICVIIA